MARHRLSRCVLLIVSIGLRSSVATGGTCCADCLDQADPLHSVVAYNPLVFEQCSAASGICCYGCSFSHGALASQDGVALDGNGAAQVAAGQQFSFRFNNVSRVTYDFLKANQAQTSFVGNESAEASVTQGVFTICSSYAGRIALRGWGTDSCTQVTDEYKIAVVEGNGTATCDSSASAVVAASASSAHNEPVDATGRDTTDSRSTDEDFGSCSATRGTVVTRADGSKVCECTGDWRNPPACDAFSYLKVVLTILGAVATVVSSRTF
jgi:predicted nucleic acid-binding Zn finger protein